MADDLRLSVLAVALVLRDTPPVWDALLERADAADGETLGVACEALARWSRLAPALARSEDVEAQLDSLHARLGHAQDARARDGGYRAPVWHALRALRYATVAAKWAGNDDALSTRAARANHHESRGALAEMADALGIPGPQWEATYADARRAAEREVSGG